MTYIDLAYRDLALAALLIVANAALSLALQLRLERQFLIATLRMVVQLSLIGLVLTKLFALSSPLWTGLAALIMVLLAGREVMARQERRFFGLWTYGIGTGCMLVGATLVTLFALSTQLRPDPWYDPRYSLMLLGMVLGNVMTGISLGLNSLTQGAASQQSMIEARLALGATRGQALLPVTRQAMRSALMPIINAMAASGLVALPGMMTGQILAGVEPVQAVKYQLLVMFLIAGGTALGALAAVQAGVFRLTDGRHRLRLDRLGPAKP